MKRFISKQAMILPILLAILSSASLAQNEPSEDAAIAESDALVAQGYNLGGQESIAYYDKAIQLNPNNFYAYYNKGTVLISLQEYTDAVYAMNSALSIKPDDVDALANKAVALIEAARTGQYTNAQAAYEKAIQACDAAMQYSGSNPRALYNRGQAEWSLGELTQDTSILERAYNDLLSTWRAGGDHALDAQREAGEVYRLMLDLGWQPQGDPSGERSDVTGTLG